MRHFDAWILRDPYSIFHYYSTGHRWKETVRDLIQSRKICAPLSLSLDNEFSSSSSIDAFARPMSPQSSSPLFTKLPLEIRLMIYEYAFGDEVVHLVQVRDKIRHVRCRNRTSSLDKNRRCCPVTPARWRADDLASSASASSPPDTSTNNMLYPHTHPSLPNHLSNSSPALLSTCRSIYTEASTFLYKNSTFDVDDLATFIAFSLSISPQHLRTIKKLSIHWRPVWQPMAGEEHKSSIFSHTHNDRLWALFWNRVASLKGLEELSLTVDLGSFAQPVPLPGAVGAGNGAGNANNGPGAGPGLRSSNNLRLSISEPWVSPLLSVRGLKTFELGITAKCDAAAKHILEGGLVHDAVQLRDHLRAVMCSERGAALPVLLGVTDEHLDLAGRLELLRRCAAETEEFERGGQGTRPRLAITAA
ncbi:hypothetical protein BDV18DRAFT_132693 [Aspergillus unguis]